MADIENHHRPVRHRTSLLWNISGADDNPLRRDCDRAEGRARSVAVVLNLVLLPLALLTGVLVAQHLAADRARQLDVLHQVTATVQVTSAPTDPPGLLSRRTGTVGWTDPDGVEHQAHTVLTLRDEVGDPVTIWVDRHERPVPDPPGAANPVVAAVLVPLLIQITGLAGSLGGWAWYRARLDRRRSAQWDLDWRRFNHVADDPGPDHRV